MNNNYKDIPKEQIIDLKLSQGDSYNGKKNNLEFFSNLFLQNYNECPDNQNYSFLTLWLILWIKNNTKNIIIEKNDGTNWKLIINKTINKSELEIFSTIFNELTLEKINFVESEVSDYYYVNFQF